MELKITKQELLKGLSLAQSAVEKKSTMPILSNVLLKAENKRLRLTATDLEIGVVCDYKAEVLAPGEMTVHAKTIYDIVKELPDSLVHIVRGKNDWLELSCGRSKFKVMGLSADEFPSLPSGADGTSYTLDSSTVLNMIYKIQHCMSTDENRYNLNGIYIEQPKEATIRMVATDGHRLSLIDRVVEDNWKLEKGVIFPRKGINELKSLLETSEGNVEIKIGKKNASIFKDNVSLVLRLIDGDFPPYSQVLPKNMGKIVSCNKVELTKALKRVSVLSSEHSRGVNFEISPNNMTIRCSNPDFGEASEELNCSYKGETFKVAFNSKYFIDTLNVLDDETITLELKDDVSPCMFRSEFDRGFTSVIMPMRL